MARRRMTLSQNFLHDPVAVHRMVRSAALRPDGLVLEPGAGEGALTRALAREARHVTAYELDPRLAAQLPRRLTGHGNVRVVRGDFLLAAPPDEPFAVVGNIPYSRTAGIVRWCLQAPRMTSATLLTQQEYARKRTGGYGRWSMLTVRTWPEYEWRLACKVSRHAFTPVPRTDSAVLRIIRRPVPLLPGHRLPAYRDFVELGFTGVGGSLAASLAGRYRTARVRAAFHELALDRSAPVGLIGPDRWPALFRLLEGDGGTHRGRNHSRGPDGSRGGGNGNGRDGRDGGNSRDGGRRGRSDGARGGRGVSRRGGRAPGPRLPGSPRPPAGRRG